jgi:hypothetical protein
MLSNVGDEGHPVHLNLFTILHVKVEVFWVVTPCIFVVGNGGDLQNVGILP